MSASSTSDLLDDLTDSQSEAVTYGDGPLLVLAGAGSGKTRVISRRIAYLLRQGVRPGNILAITFTNKAAGEMRARVEALVPGCAVRVCTFHSLGASLLRQYADRLGLDRNFTIYDQNDRIRVLKAAIETAGKDSVRYTPEGIESAISRAKNQLLRPEAYAAKADDYYSNVVAAIYPLYEKRLRDANALDFDDLLLWPALALRQDAELQEELDARFRYVLVDEYQDTNQAQYAIARGLSMRYPNLFVVGDPDQSIYRWRGSDLRNILDFERDFPQARTITLNQNYRSTKWILHAASHLISHNRQRKPKTLQTENPAGRPVSIVTYDSSLEESEGIAQQIRAAVSEKGRCYHDFAVFMRTNALSRNLESAFIKHRVPYQIVRGLAFFARKENRDVLAYLRLLLNPRDNLSFLRAVAEPSRGIGKTTLAHLEAYAEPREMSLLDAAGQVDNIPAIKGKAGRALKEFAGLIHDLQSLSDAPPDEVMIQVLDRSGYRDMLEESKNPEDQDRLANVEEMISAVRQFAREDIGHTLADFLESVTLASDVDGWDDKQDCVSIMTLHAAKGLEFPVVFMVAVENGLVPHERSISESQRTGKADELEEERRLAFVGMTRAKEELYMTRARQRDYRGRILYTIDSIFLGELPEEGVDWIDRTTGSDRSSRAFDRWRQEPAAAWPGWLSGDFSSSEAEGRARSRPVVEESTGPGFAEGMVVSHETYGVGKITEVRGTGILRRVRVRFQLAGERTFIEQKARLTIVESE